MEGELARDNQRRERNENMRGAYMVRFFIHVVASSNRYRHYGRTGLTGKFKRTALERKQPSSLTPRTFREDKHSIAAPDLFHSVVDRAQGLADIFPVNEETTDQEDPDIEDGNEREFLFCDETYAPPDQRQQEYYVKDAPVITHNAETASFRDMFQPLHREMDSRQLNEEMSPALSNPTSQSGHSLSQPTNTEEKRKYAQRGNDYQAYSYDSKDQDRDK
jgi:hypothetical protein